MATYNVLIEDELSKELKEIADEADTSVSKMIQQYLDNNLKDAKVELVIQQYKIGNLTARKAWKMSGLSFDEFNELAKE